MRIFNKGFNVSQDGPGNRLVYHLQGCNFRCKWCSNPEGMDPNASGLFEMSPDDIIKETMSCRPMFFEGGGVTFTGGEATLQHAQLLTTLKGLKENGIHTCIESNASDPHLDELLPYIDYLIVDLKHVDVEKHTYWTGASHHQTLQNIADILKSGRQVLIRIPLIRHVNVNPQGYVTFFKQYPMDHAQIEILPYHEYGKDKWTEEYCMQDGFVDEEEIKSMTDAFEKEGYHIIHT